MESSVIRTSWRQNTIFSFLPDFRFSRMTSIVLKLVGKVTVKKEFYYTKIIELQKLTLTTAWSCWWFWVPGKSLWPCSTILMLCSNGFDSFKLSHWIGSFVGPENLKKWLNELARQSNITRTRCHYKFLNPAILLMFRHFSYNVLH